MAKNQSLSKIGKEFDELVADMKKTAAEWTKASGSKKDLLLRKLKQMTKEKKELQAEMERAVMDIDKDVELQVDERYLRVVLKSSIKRLVESQLKMVQPNRSQRRLAERTDSSAKANQFKSFARKTFTMEHYQLVAEAFGVVNEEGGINKSQIEDTLLQIVKQLKSKGVVNDVPKDIDIDAMMKNDHENAVTESKRLNESVTALLAIPGIITLIGRAIDWIYRKAKFTKEEHAEYKKHKKIYKKLKRDRRVSDDALHHYAEKHLNNTKVGGWLKDVGHKLHSWLSIPLRTIIAGLIWMYPPENKTIPFRQAWNKARRATDIIMTFALITIAGYGIAHTYMSEHGITLGKQALSAAEGTDIAVSAEEAISSLQAIDVSELALELGEEIPAA